MEVLSFAVAIHCFVREDLAGGFFQGLDLVHILNDAQYVKLLHSGQITHTSRFSTDGILSQERPVVAEGRDELSTVLGVGQITSNPISIFLRS